jgi:hypothetical protein
MRRAASRSARGKGSEMLLWFGAARSATPYPRSTYQVVVAATAFRRGRSVLDAAPAAGAGESRSTA